MSDTIDSNPTDHAVGLAKAALGMIPIAGPFLAELAGTIIPRQRADRLADFARLLSRDLALLNQETLRAKLNNENFTDLLEEATREAVSAVSADRREYIAKLVSCGLTEDCVSYVESRHLLRLLGQVNDIEIIWLRFYDYTGLSGDEEFREKHSEILKPIVATLASGPDVIDRQALQKNYVARLESIGLLERPMRVNPANQQPEFDPIRREWQSESRRTSPLGRLLLRQIGIAASGST